VPRAWGPSMDVYTGVGGLALVACAVAAAAALALVLRHLNAVVARPGEAPVKLSLNPLLGDALGFSSDPVGFIQGLSRKYGDVAGAVIGGKRMFFITDPRAFRDLVRNKNKALSFDEFTQHILHDIFGVSWKVSSSYDDVPFHKQYLEFLYSDRGLGDLTERMQLNIFQQLSAVKSGVEVDMYDMCSRVIFEASLASIFSVPFARTPGLYEDFVAFDAHFPLAMGGIPYAVSPAAAAARRRLHDRLVELRRGGGEGVSTFVQHREGEYTKQSIGDTDAAAMTLSMLWAAVGNTGPAFFWTLFYVLRDPQVLRDVQDELSTVLGPLPASSSPLVMTQAQLNALTILDACVSEALRLASMSLTVRGAVGKGASVTGADGTTYRLRRGDVAVIASHAVHMDPDLYPEPHEFRYQRFIAGESTPASEGLRCTTVQGSQLTGSELFMAFGQGAHKCPGRRFARNEVKTCVAALLRALDVELTAGDGCAPPALDVKFAGLGVVPPKGDVRLRILGLRSAPVA